MVRLLVVIALLLAPAACGVVQPDTSPPRYGDGRGRGGA